MKKTIKGQSLRETNPYLKNKVMYEKALIKNVISSSRIEGIKSSPLKMSKIKI